MKLSDIKIDDAIYPRNGVDHFHVGRLIDAIETGAKFPPLVIEAGTHRLVDGRHRYEAMTAKDIKSTKVIEKTYANDADLFADAARLNIDHGLKLSNFDIKHVIARLEDFGFTRDKIGDIVRTPMTKIEEIARGFASGPAGEAVALKGGLHHKKGMKLTERQVEVNRHYAGGKPVFYVNQIIALLESDLWPRDNTNFVEAMGKLVILWHQLTTKNAA